MEPRGTRRAVFRPWMRSPGSWAERAAWSAAVVSGVEPRVVGSAGAALEAEGVVTEFGVEDEAEAAGPRVEWIGAVAGDAEAE